MFKIGDIVTCKQQYKSEYRITKPGILVTVSKSVLTGEFTNSDKYFLGIYDGERYQLTTDYFELVNPSVSTKGLAYQIWLQEQLSLDKLEKVC